MDIKETIERDLTYVGSLEALITLIEETAEGHPYTIVFGTEPDYHGVTNPVIQVTRTRPETPEEEMRRQKMEMSAEEQRELDIFRKQRQAEVDRILNQFTLEELRCIASK